MFLDDYFKAKDPQFNINNSLPLARPGLPFVALELILMILFFALGWTWLAWILTAFFLFTLWFFRDPARPTPPGDFGLSPADGQIIRIEDVASNPYTEGPAKKVSIFMNVFSVHVNRAAFSGKILKQIYYPGFFLNASWDKASEQNERNAVILETPDGRQMAMVQIAGLVARRIVSWVEEGEELQRGQRFGMIRFGSRVDLYLPPEVEVMVSLGQKVNAGWSPIWKW